MTTIAGNGTQGDTGDTGAAADATVSTLGIAVDASGNLYLAEEGNRVRKTTASTGIITTIAGTGTAGDTGDGSSALSADVSPWGISVDTAGNVYISDIHDNVVREITAAGNIRTIAGVATAGFAGDDGPATSAKIDYPEGVSVNASGDIYIADTSNNRIRATGPPRSSLRSSRGPRRRRSCSEQL
jgi:trimeric autotransporter adhesin